MDNVFIYSLSDPRDNQIKYIGKAIDPNVRLSYHLRNRNQGNTMKNNWIKYLVNNNLYPTLQILDEVPETEWQFWERYWIAQIKAWGFNLKNGDNGGLGFDRFNEETKAKISKTLSGRCNPDRYVSYLKFDLKGNLLRKYDSLKEIKNELNLTLHNSNIPTSFKKHTTAYGFIWIKEGANVSNWFKQYYKREISTRLNRQLRASTIADKYLKGKKASIETRRKQSLAKLGKPTWNKGMTKKQMDGYRA